jgi:twitching motility protein PilT
MGVSLQELLSLAVAHEASDLHLSAGTYPHIRLHGSIEPLEQFEKLTPSDIQRMIYSVLTEVQQRHFEAGHDLDLSFGMEHLARFRCNVYRQQGVICVAMRLIPQEIRTLEDLQLPEIVEQLTRKQMGLVLVTGPTGSGKSTTLAAMTDKINAERRAHIITVEDPIEFIHRHKKSLVHQREIPSDTPSFHDALRSIPRENPDVVLVGEMRDLETISATLTIAETGHLTFATLHTRSCAQTITRIIDAFPSSQQNQIRTQLSMVLEGVLSQILLPTAAARGQVLAMEIMVPTMAIRHLIREGKVHEIYSSLQAGSRLGMQTMSQSLANLVRAQKVAPAEALARAPVPEEVAVLLAAPGNGGAPFQSGVSTGLAASQRQGASSSASTFPR